MTTHIFFYSPSVSMSLLIVWGTSPEFPKAGRTCGLWIVPPCGQQVAHRAWIKLRFTHTSHSPYDYYFSFSDPTPTERRKSSFPALRGGRPAGTSAARPGWADSAAPSPSMLAKLCFEGTPCQQNHAYDKMRANGISNHLKGDH